MRNDVMIDNVKVIAPNATTLGFCTRVIKRDTFFVYGTGADYNTKQNYLLARSLGRINASGKEGPAVKNFVLAMVLNTDAQHCFERWVDPSDIIEAYPCAPTNLAAVFFAQKLPYDARTMRRLMEHGTMSEQYVQHIHDRVDLFNQRLKSAHDAGNCLDAQPYR